MSDPTSSSCGIGTPQDQQGSCTGTLFPSDAGKGVFDGISASPVASAFAGAGLLMAAILFAVFLSHAVGGFFGKKRKPSRGGRSSFSAAVEQHMREHPESEAFSAVMKEHQREHGDVERGDANDLDRVCSDDVEMDREDDTEEGLDDADWDTDSPGYRRKFE